MIATFGFVFTISGFGLLALFLRWAVLYVYKVAALPFANWHSDGSYVHRGRMFTKRTLLYHFRFRQLNRQVAERELLHVIVTISI